MNANSAHQDFFVAGGTLWREAPSYLFRPADEELYQHARSGEYCNVLASRQMGKSSLMVRTANRLQEEGMRTAFLDISTLGSGISSPETWFFGFLDELAFQLNLEGDLDAWWEMHRNLNPVQRFSNFLREVLLAQVSSQIAVFVDEIDSALGMDFTDDFFAAIRAAFNARATHADFQRLTFILLGVARPADLIRDRNRTPYNIGAHIHLSDFTLVELDPYRVEFEKTFPGQASEIIKWVLDWTNGQPYLTQKLCAELINISENPITEEYVSQTVTRLFLKEEARKESNLRAIRDRIEWSPHRTRLLQIYKNILGGRPVLDEERSPAKNELKLTGLVRASDDGRLVVRNRIYSLVFDLEWVKKGLPISRTRQVAVFASIFAFVAIFVAGYALYQRQIQAAATFAEQFELSNSPEVKLTSLARLLELDDRSNLQAREIYSSLSPDSRLNLFTGLSEPQNVADEVVTVIEAFYQDNDNSAEGNATLGAMRTVLGRIGAPGAPGLKTEIEFWLKGREEAELNEDPRTAVSFYNSAWLESVARGHPNIAVRFDRAFSLIDMGNYSSAFEDLQQAWELMPDKHETILSTIRNVPPLAGFFLDHPAANPAIVAFITPVPPTSTETPTRTPRPSSTPLPAPSATASPEPSATPTAMPTSPYTGWVVFGFGEGANREIVILNPVTGNRLQVTNNGFTDEAPSFSADNWKLVYSSNRSQDGWELYAYDLRRGTEQQLTSFNGQARFPAWSPKAGDSRVVFEGRTFEPENATNIWMVDVLSGDLTQLTFSGADSRPAWSPDGSLVVFGRATEDTTGDGRITVNDMTDIYTLDLKSGVETNLTNSPGFDDFNVSWSPDGRWIAFTSVRGDANSDGVINLNDSIGLYVLAADGSRELALDLDGKRIYSPSWSQDGRYILVLVANLDGSNEIWRYEFQTGVFTSLTESGPYHHPSSSNAP